MTSGKTASQISKEFGVMALALGPVDTPAPRTVDELARENAQLRRELARVTIQRDILKINDGHVRSVEERYQMIADYSQTYPIRELCAALRVSRSGYYAWRDAGESARELGNRVMAQAIKQLFEAKRRRYGSPRITAQLRRQGQVCNHKRVERLMRQQGLRARCGRKRKVRTTQSDHDQPVAQNLLKDRPAPTKADEVWVADITYVPTTEGWLFVAAVMDLYSRQILGWSVWKSLAAEGALQALERALAKSGYPRGVIHHSDRGIQYACAEYRYQLKRHGLVASMSRKGNCYDNAAMEAFWSTLKREALDQSETWSADRVRRDLFEFIESNYNRRRLLRASATSLVSLR